MTRERKTFAQIKAEKAEKREAAGKPPVPSMHEIREQYNAEKEARRERQRISKLQRKGELFCCRCFELIHPGQDTGKLNGYVFHAPCLEDLQQAEYEGADRDL